MIEKNFQTLNYHITFKVWACGINFLRSQVNCQILRTFAWMAKPTTFQKEQTWSNEPNSVFLNKKNLGCFSSKKLCEFFRYNSQ